MMYETYQGIIVQYQNLFHKVLEARITDYHKSRSIMLAGMASGYRTKEFDQHNKVYLKSQNRSTWDFPDDASGYRMLTFAAEQREHLYLVQVFGTDLVDEISAAQQLHLENGLKSAHIKLPAKLKRNQIIHYHGKQLALHITTMNGAADIAVSLAGQDNYYPIAITQKEKMAIVQARNLLAKHKKIKHVDTLVDTVV